MRILALLAVVSLLRGAEGEEFFERKVRPVLVARCQGCHGAEKQFAALRLDSRDSILRGGMKGPAAVPGQPEASLLIRAVKHMGPKMPMGEKLPEAEIAVLEEWVRAGMVWPARGKPAAAGLYEKLLREHWAYQPVRRVAPPAGKAAHPVDRFLDAKRAAAGLAMAGPAERRVLARRAAYVVTGLPPAPELLERFLSDRGTGAYERYVDALLASPRYGERWARHWMDVVRFAETYGYEWNYEIQGAWRYRDYLIRAFNADVPYNQFVREHVAGDLLGQPRVMEGRNESVLATAFYRMGEMGHDNCNQFREIRTDVVDNQIDTFTKAFQGATVSCARCHDHKIDPIPTEDYYALYGILNSSRAVARTLETRAVAPAGLAELKTAIRQELAAAWLEGTRTLGAELQAALAGTAEGSRWSQLLKREKVDLADPLAVFAHSGEVYAKEAAARERFNREKFVTAADFTQGVPAGWSAEGLGLQAGVARTGDFAVATEGQAALEGIFQAGLVTNLVTDRWNGSVRSPLLPAGKKFVSLQVMGGKFAARRVIVDHCVIGEDYDLIETPRLRWERVSTKDAGKFPVYLELNTRTDNPRFPDRPGRLKKTLDGSGRSYFGVTRVVYHDEEAAPQESLEHLRELWAAPTAERFAERAQRAVRAWGAGTATAADVTWLQWLVENGVVANARDLTPALRELTERYRAAEAGLAAPTVVAGMGDFDPGKDHPIFLAGSAVSPGPVAPRHFLSLMPEQLKAVGPQGSGRRELAEAMASAENPLTARVMVNRIWHHVFGRGIVASTDDFGRNGAAPSHPELLDYLAAEFGSGGWSVKAMVRRLVTTAAFQQGSTAEAGARAKDPANALLHHYPVRRLEAEAVRDTLLAVSGRLDGTLYGPSVQPHRGEPQEHRRLFQGPLDGNGRRSIYVKITRMEGPRFLEIFDFPSPLQTRGNRDVTNVPPQALAILNDPFVLDQARVWARALTAQKDDAVEARVGRMFLAGLGRPATAAELGAWRELVGEMGQRHGAADLLGSEAVWTDVAHTLFNLKEFLYLR
jgi:cytochrome c553